MHVLNKLTTGAVVVVVVVVALLFICNRDFFAVLFSFLRDNVSYGKLTCEYCVAAAAVIIGDAVIVFEYDDNECLLLRFYQHI